MSSAPKEDDYDEYDIDIENYSPYYDTMSEILPNLYLSDYVAAANPDIVTHGITHVISLGGFEDHNLYVIHKDADYYHVFIDDHPNEPISEHFDECIGFIEHGMREGKVLVHCHAGISRSATIVIAYLMHANVKNGTPPNYLSTYKLVKSKRGCINPNGGFIEQLMEHETSLKLNLMKKTNI